MIRDERVLAKYADLGVTSNKMKQWIGVTEDPTVQVQSVSAQFPIIHQRLVCIRVALRIMQAHRVPTERANQLARACGHDGETAFRAEDYGAILEEKWGPVCHTFTDADLMSEMNRRGRKVTTAEGGFKSDKDRRQYYDAVKTLRCSLWAMEMFDIEPELAHRSMLAFQWSNMWQTLTPVGVVAFEIEDYATRMLSRREHTRGS
jgi:hypothetical protein